MLKRPVEEALNAQINAELYSSYLYLAMSAWAESRDLPGAANWFRIQAQEELVHMMRFFDYVNDRDGRVALAAIDAPTGEWTSPTAAFEHTYEHEQVVTELINGLVRTAREHGDELTHNMLQWFVAEQVEEEASVRTVLGKLRLAGDSGAALFMLDNELAQRVFVAPAAL